MPSISICSLKTLLAAALLLWPSSTLAERRQHPTSSNWHVEATMRGRFPAKLRFQVISALKRADHRLQGRAECRELFSSLGAEGAQALRSSAFSVAASERESSICLQRSAAALTTVGGSETHLCEGRFGKLSVDEAAVILLHEALHQAGLSEWPIDPNGLTSTQINQLVRRRCAL